MSLRSKNTGNDKYLGELFECIQEFAGKMEDSFGQINRNFTVFKAKIGEIRKRHVSEISTAIQLKSDLAKKKALAKANKMKKNEKNEPELLNTELKNCFEGTTSIVNVDDDFFGSVFLDEKETKSVKEQDPITDLVLDIQLNDIALDDLLDKKDVLWKKYFQTEMKRIKQSDPKAEPSEITKFITAQWNKMTTQEKLKWKQPAFKKQSKLGNKFSGKAPSPPQLDLKEASSMFTHFLAKKKTKFEQEKNAESGLAKKQQGQKKEEKLISASLLVSKLNEGREGQPGESSFEVADKLKRMFEAYQS